VHCAAGYRSMVFISLLRTMGYNNLIDVQGGFNALKATGKLQLTEYQVQATEL